MWFQRVIEVDHDKFDETIDNHTSHKVTETAEKTETPKEFQRVRLHVSNERTTKITAKPRRRKKKTVYIWQCVSGSARAQQSKLVPNIA